MKTREHECSQKSPLSAYLSWVPAPFAWSLLPWASSWAHAWRAELDRTPRVFFLLLLPCKIRTLGLQSHCSRCGSCLGLRRLRQEAGVLTASPSHKEGHRPGMRLTLHFLESEASMGPGRGELGRPSSHVIRVTSLPG